MDDRAEPVTEPLSIGSDDLRVDVIETGASLVGVWVPDRAGVIDNVVLRLEDPRHYRRPERNPYLGSTVGRYANRILGGRIDLDGEGFELTANEGTTSLHGGPDGWSFRTWTVTEHLPDSVTLELVSPDGDMGFPGEVTVAVTYSASGSTLRIEAEAVTDAPTVVSMTNHAYWNLDGARAGSNLDDHRLALASPGYPTPAEAAIGTWDDWFELDTDPAAVLASVGSGRRMELRTTSGGVQLYTADSMGPPFGPRAALCLEPGTRPNTAQECVLRPGETYRWSCEFEFGVFGDGWQIGPE